VLHQQARLVALVLLVLCVSTPVQAQRLTTASVEALHRWVDAVNGHQPGRPDAAVGSVAAMTYAARRDLNTSFPVFIRVLRDEFVATNSEVEKGVTTYARMVRNDPGIATFLKRAAILHADAVVFARRFPEPPDDAPPVLPPSQSIVAGDPARLERAASPPLLTNERVTVTRDGEIIGDAKLYWSLPFARSLLDMLLRFPSDPVSRDDYAFVADWYHTVAAYLFARGLNGDATGHLRHAARVLPDEPHALFDRGTYAEWFGLPIYQALGDALMLSEDKTNADAERLYRRTLEVDPSYVEARVRLARLLDRRGRHDEAAAEIAAALDGNPAGITGFYAHIVAGRIATARGRYAEALRFYREASNLYDHAQSALVGASHAALMLADVPGTLAPLAALGGESRPQDADPWLDYGLGAGRDVNTLLAALWSRAAD
jgi:tetratricopeptide (TPR) repeat protein